MTEFCTGCGAERRAADRFCAACGAAHALASTEPVRVRSKGRVVAVAVAVATVVAALAVAASLRKNGPVDEVRPAAATASAAEEHACQQLELYLSRWSRGNSGGSASNGDVMADLGAVHEAAFNSGNADLLHGAEIALYALPQTAISSGRSQEARADYVRGLGIMESACGL